MSKLSRQKKEEMSKASSIAPSPSVSMDEFSFEESHASEYSQASRKVEKQVVLRTPVLIGGKNLPSQIAA